MKFLGPPQSGSSQGDTSSRSRFGQYYRSRRAPVNPNSGVQSLSRSRLAAASQAWRGLAEVVRRAWNAAAAERPLQDALGQTVYQTGAQMFIGLYTSLKQAGLSVPPNVPTQSPPFVTALTAGASAGTAVLNVGFGATIPSGTVAIVDCSPLQSAGISFCKDYRFVRLAAGVINTDIACGSAYLAKFGDMIAGKKIFIRGRLVTAAGGVSVPQFVTVIVGA